MPRVSNQLKNYQWPDQFGRWMGYRVVSVNRKKGEALMELKLRDDHLSPAGRVHGGVISSFFDMACGGAVFLTMEPDDFTSTVELKVNYFSPLNSGDVLRCHSKVVFRGKHLCVVHALMYRNGLKKPVAMATGTFNIVHSKA